MRNARVWTAVLVLAAAFAPFPAVAQTAPLSFASPSTLVVSTVGYPSQAQISASGGIPFYIFTVAAGALPPGLSLNYNGSFSGLPSQAGTYSFTVQVQDNVGATLQQSFSQTILPARQVVCGSNVTITQNSIPNVRPNTGYNQTLTACGGTGPYAFTIPSLNAGAVGCGMPGGPCCWTGAPGQSSLAGTGCNAGFTCVLPQAPVQNAGYCANAGAQEIGSGSGIFLHSDGTISGVAASTGAYHFFVAAVDSQGNASSAYGAGQNFTLIIADPLAINTSALPNGEVNWFMPEQPISMSGGIHYHSIGIECINGPLNNYTGGAAHIGCQTDGAFGGGTPGVAGTYTVTIQVADAVSGMVSLTDPNVAPQTVTKTAAPLTIFSSMTLLTASLADGTEGVAYSTTVQVGGGDQAHLGLNIQGTFPAGLSSSGGTISGTPGAGTAGAYPLTLHVSDGIAWFDQPFTLNILPSGQSFSFGVQPASQGIVAGSSATYTVTVTPHNGFSGTVNFSVSGLPSGATLVPLAVPVSGGSAMGSLSINTTNNVSTGTYSLTIQGTSGALSYSQVVSLKISQLADFSVSLPSPVSVAVSSSASYNGTVSPLNGFSGNVNFSVSGAPAGVAAGVNPVFVAGGAAGISLNVSAAANASTGTYPLTVTATSGSLRHDVPVTLIVNPADCGSPPFGLSLAPQAIGLTAGQSSATVVSIQAIGGFSGGVPLTISSPDPTITAGFSPNPAPAGGSSQMTLQTSPATPLGTFSIPVLGQYTGTSGGTCRASASLSLAVYGGGGGGGGVHSGTIKFFNNDGVTNGINLSQCNGAGILSSGRAATSPSDSSFVMAWPDGGLPFYGVVSTGTAGQAGVRGNLYCANALNALAGGFYSTAQSSGNWTFGVQSGTWSFTQDAAPPAPAKLAIGAGASVASGACSPGTVNVQNADGAAAALPLASDLYVLLFASGSKMGFYGDSSCAQALSSSTFKIPSGANSGQFFFRDQSVEISTLTAAGGGLLYARQAVAVTTASACSYPRPGAFTFTDALTAHQTVIRAVYVNELRGDINILRADAGLSVYPWTSPPTALPHSTLIRAVYFTELRGALGDVYNACGQPPPSYADAVLIPGATIVRTSAVQDLRNAVLNAK